MTRIIFQQAAEAGCKTPWAVIFEGGRIIYGRPDATAIIGFSPDGLPGAKMITTHVDIEDSQDIVGMRPVFIDGGNIFSDTRPIASASEWHGSDANAEALHAREVELRGTLERSGAVAQTFTVIGTRNGFGFPHGVAAIRGRHDAVLDDDEQWVTYVQSLNGEDALREAQEQMELADSTESLREEVSGA